MSIIIGIDHGYYAIKTAHCSFPAGLGGMFGKHSVWISKRTFGVIPKPPLCADATMLSRCG